MFSDIFQWNCVFSPLSASASLEVHGSRHASQRIFIKARVEGPCQTPQLMKAAPLEEEGATWNCVYVIYVV